MLICRAFPTPTSTTDKDHTTTPGTPCPTLCEKCVGSLTSPANQYKEDAGDGAYGLSSLSEKTRTSNHLSRWASFILSFLRNTTSCQHGGSNPSRFSHEFSGIPNDVIHVGLYKCFLSWSDFSMTLLRQVLFYVTSNKN